MRMLPYIAAILLAVTPADAEAAYADLDTLSPEQQKYTVYWSLSDVPADKQDALAAAAKVVACSLSHKPHLPSQNPQRVEGSALLRLDTYALGWESTYGTVLREHYPYRRDLTRDGKYPLIASALWFVAQVTDPVETPGAHDLLLYGKQQKALNDVLAFWKVQNDQNLFYGYLEGKSGVSVKRARTLEQRPVGNRGYSWGTKDFEKFDLGSDPLENLKPGTTRFDAAEWIIGIPKQAHGKLGMLQAYLLADAKGNLQAKAPAAIVVDHLQTRGVEIRNWVSCIACHPTGLVDPTHDEYRQYLTSGANITTYDKVTKEAIENYLENDIAGELKRNRELYAVGIEMVCGLSPEEFATAYVAAVKAYDAEVTLEQAAREVGCEPAELVSAIGYQSARGVNAGARVAQLAHKVPIARDRWEENGHEWASYYVKQWREAK